MQLPQFIDLDLSTTDDGGFPTALSWSLPNGQIKSVLIIPDDDWNPWENADGSVDIQLLMDNGVSGPDAIRELNEDLDGQTVYVDGLDEDEVMLELLYDTYNHSLSFEVASISQLFTQHPFEELLSLRNDIAQQHQFDIERIEDKVKSLVFVSDQLLS
jgi:hypothetical protein